MMKRFLVVAYTMLISLIAAADEGMWMVNSLSRALVQKMEKTGLELSGNEIYNADKVSLTDAIVSLDFGCSGSLVSARGLLITNHHCAYSDVHSLSTAEHNYLEDGFWARNDEDEIYIPGKSVYLLEKVLDVTDEVNAVIQQEKDEGRPAGMRRVSYLIEKKYKQETSLEASLSSMWAGSKYYLALYKVYTDIRLVAAPPVSISAYGGDEDNWEWPQHKCDFALYRIYSAPDGSPAPHSNENVPLAPKRILPISQQGYSIGDFTMIIGYPGKTDRYTSSAKLSYRLDTELPIINKIREDQMAVISSWMDKDPSVRLKYSDKYFSLSNVGELGTGEELCYKRFNTVGQKRKSERILKGKENKQLLRTLSEKYEAYRTPRRNLIYYRENLLRGSELGLIATRLKNAHSRSNPQKEYEALDMRVERDLFDISIESFYENTDSTMWGPYRTEVRNMFLNGGKADYKALCDYLWTDDIMTKEDRIYKFYIDNSIREFNEATDKAQGTPNVSELGKEYTHALYKAREAKGMLQYPDANSTMRLTFGTVSTFKRDSKLMPYQTFSEQVLEKEDTLKYDFTLKDDWRALLQKVPSGSLPVNFITDCDITGGNSGSPVINGRGELIGLAFDGNKESLASDVSFTPGYNKCVCVDIRYVLWTLENYAHMDRIIAEMNILPARVGNQN